METELIVVTANTNASLDLKDNLPISLNFAIADIRDPSKRNGAFSKTIKLPGSATNNTFFEHIYDVNISTRNFNPNLKTDCYVLQEGIEIFRGYLRLTEIEVYLENDTEKIEYSVTIFGDNKDLFGVIGDAKLQDLSVSEFDHVYNRVNQFNTWSAAVGTGYFYPLIDYGYNAFQTNSFNVEHLRPAFYVKSYIDKIFAAAGKSYTSSFFNSTFFKRWYIPHNGDKFTMSAAAIALKQFYAGDNGAGTVTSTSLVYNTTKTHWETTIPLTTTTLSTLPCVFNDDTTSPFTDPANIYNTTTGIATINSTGNYSFSCVPNFEAKVTAPAGTVTFNNSSTLWSNYYLLRSTDGGVTWNYAYSYSQQNILNLTTNYQSISSVFASPVLSANAGDKFKVSVIILQYWSTFGIRFYDGVPNPITSGTASVECRLKNTATLQLKLATTDYASGQSMSINDAIPKDVKQKDLLTSVFKLGNLYVDVDPSDTNNYLIETRDDFYTAGVTKDWTEKLATDRPFIIKLMMEIDVKNFIYRYKSDTDYYNKQYEDIYQEPYGSYKKIVNNDFTLKDDVTDVIFSPTPVVDNSNNSMILPKIFSYDGTSVKPQKHNLRILMNNGTAGNTPTWNYVAPAADGLGAAVLPMSQYPLSAMVNDPLNPTSSIEFGVPDMVFYSLGSNYTTNNIYNREYSKFITEVTDRDSRIVIAYFYLTPTDIATFDFRDKIYVKDTLYFVNKISDYNKLKPGLSKVELLKIKTASAYEPTQVEVGQIETNGNNTGMTARLFGMNPNDTNTGNANNVLIGDNNSSRSVGSFISGSRNSVDVNSSRVTVISTVQSNTSSLCDGINLVGCSGVNVGMGCSGIVLFNCSGVNIEDYTYNFTGINLTNENIVFADSAKAKVGVLTTFESSGTSL